MQGLISVAAVVVGAALAVVAIGSFRFRRGVRREASRLWSAIVPPRPLERSRVGDLPGPVCRYLMKALGARDTPIQGLRLHHGGSFRPRLEGGWCPIRGQQYFSASPPGFVWWGRARLGPGLWVEARDESVGGHGSMRVMAESVVTLADASGPGIDRGALHRLLAEMTLFPTGFLNDRYVRWAPIDDTHARATLAVNGCEVSGAFTFGGDGLPCAFAAERPRDVGGGRSVLTPWSGTYADYRLVGGVSIPHDLSVSWYVDGRTVPYAHFIIDRLELDVVEPY